ncbi:MAG: DUF262 domain-containing protein [Candidatus Aquilonibacter sp.]
MFSEREIGMNFDYRSSRASRHWLAKPLLVAAKRPASKRAGKKRRGKRAARSRKTIVRVSRALPSEFRCDACDFVYNTTSFGGVIPEDQPEDWACPECGASADHFQVLVPSDRLDDAEDDDVEGDDVTLEVASGRRMASIKARTIEVSSLRKRRDRGDLDLQPKFQRYDVWTDKIRSALIESILLDLPIPTIYLAENADGKFVVVDGQQRLTAIFRFIENAYPLKGLTALRGLNGMFFRDLPEVYKARIEDRSLDVTEIFKETHHAVRFQLFERLNRGSVKLNDQELRNCIYRGPYNDFVTRLASDPILRKALRLKSGSRHARMVDCELALRFLAFFEQTYEKHPDKRTGEFLNRQMDLAQKGAFTPAQIEKQERAFESALQSAQTVYGDEHLFKRYRAGDASDPNGGWEPRLNRALMDVVLNVFARIPKRDLVKHADEIRMSTVELMSTEKFSDLLKHTISSADRIRQRFQMFENMVREIIGDNAGKARRSYSSATRDALFRSSNRCGICNNKIMTVDDAHVDHKTAFALGGKTELANARITHQFCNQSRGAGKSRTRKRRR